MKKFNIQNKCPKCGCGNVCAMWMKEENLIKRTCERCLYTWCELPLDYIPKEDEKFADKTIKAFICKSGHSHLTDKDRKDCENDKIGVMRKPPIPTKWCVTCEAYLKEDHVCSEIKK